MEESKLPCFSKVPLSKVVGNTQWVKTGCKKFFTTPKTFSLLPWRTIQPLRAAVDRAPDLQGLEHLLGQSGWLETGAFLAIPGCTPCISSQSSGCIHARGSIRRSTRAEQTPVLCCIPFHSWMQESEVEADTFVPVPNLHTTEILL